jgi:hypothetical protein
VSSQSPKQPELGIVDSGSTLKASTRCRHKVAKGHVLAYQVTTMGELLIRSETNPERSTNRVPTDH